MDKWFAAVTARGVRVSGPILQKKAEEIAQKLGHETFRATTGWFARWKARQGIKFKKAHGEKQDADFNGAEIWKTNELPDLLKEFDPEDIHNADETGLCFRATPNGSLCCETAERI